MPKEPAEKSLLGVIAAHARWKNVPDLDKRRAATEAARAARRKQIEQQVDPDGVLNAEDLDRAVQNAINEQMARVRLAKARAARERKCGGDHAWDDDNLTEAMCLGCGVRYVEWSVA